MPGRRRVDATAVALPAIPATLDPMTERAANAKEEAARLVKDPNFNIPNTITVVRLLMIPGILYSFDGRFEHHQLVAFVLFTLASLSDSLDGRIARRYARVTTLGKFLDPLADKLLILAVLALLVQDSLLPAWVAIVIVGRELLITGLRSIGAAQGLIIAATPFGKTKTVSQMLAVGLVMLERPYPALNTVALVAVALAVGFTVFSGIDYVWRYRRLLYR
jgi:CDP-diacylglycerol--glycerol-3-phosphate 3-phosphatidyltransferase